MSTKPRPESEKAPAPSFPFGKDELNLAEFPIALLADRVPAGQKTMEFEDEIYDERRGQVVTRRLTVTASDKFGLPTAKDDELLLGLMQLTFKANGFTDRHVNFTRLELLKLLGWEDTGQNYRRIDTSLSRWAGVLLHWENSWWDKQQQSWTTRGFHIIESYEINDSRQANGQLELPYSRFTWNEIIFKNFSSGYLKRLDLDFYLSLRHATSKRMYRFLDKRFFHRPDWTFPLRTFACEHVGLSRGYSDAGKFKEKLQPAIEELQAVGFIETMSREERYTKVGPGEWTITIRKKSQARARGETAAPRKKADNSEIDTELTNRGVTLATAVELVSSHQPEHIRECIEIFDWLVSKKDNRVSKNPGGYLAESIRKSYARPKGFESKAESEKKRAAEQERTRRAEEAKQRTEREQQARDEAEQGRIAAYLEALTVEERGAIEAEAIEKAAPFFVQQLRRNKGSPETEARYLKLILDMHVSSILKLH